MVKDYDSDQVHWTFTEEEYLKSLKINVQNTLSYCEVFSANLCKVGLTRNFDIEFDGFCSVQDLTKSSKGKEFFESPYLLRCRPDFRFNISWPLPSGSAGPRRDKRNQGAEKALRGMESDFSYALKGSKTLRLHVREPEKALCAKQGIPGQKEALGQIQLINYFVFAEEQAVVVLDGIICTKSQDVISRADDIKRHFERLKRKFLALLDIIIEDCSTLSLDQLKEADALVAAHNKEWAALEAFVAEVAKTNPQLNASAMTQDKAQKDGEVYMNIISYLIKYEEEAIGCLERAEQLIPEPLIAQYIQIKETFFGLHRNFSRIRDEMLESHVVIDEKRALEAQRLSEDHKIAWISFERFTLEVAKCMV